MTSQTDQRWMAGRWSSGMGQAPITPVSVIVKGDRVVGQGWTQASGDPMRKSAIGMAQQKRSG